MRRFILMAMLAALVVTACGDDDEEQAGPARPDPLLGVNLGELDNNADLLRREMQVMAESGVTTARAPFSWKDAQPVRRFEDLPPGWRRAFRSANGRPTNFAATDRLVAAAARAHIAFLPVVIGTPSWAARHPSRHKTTPRPLMGVHMRPTCAR